MQSTKKRSNALPITVYTNGNKYDSKRFIFNPRYVRTFDALLDQITLQTNATCAVRKIYTPHGSRQVGNLSGIESGGSYVAVSRGRFKKVPYGQGSYGSSSDRTTTTTTKTPRRQKEASSRLQRSYEDLIKTQKTIYVHRNGFSEAPIQIFFAKRLLRDMSQVLDLVQEKIVCERAIVSLHKLNGLTIDEVSKLQSEGTYVALEQGQRFKRMVYDQVDGEMSSPRRQKLPAIKTGAHYTGRNAADAKPHQRLPSNESSQGGQVSKAKPKFKLPVIKQWGNEPPELEVIYGYPRKEPDENERTRRFQPAQNRSYQGVFYASGVQGQIASEIRDDKRVRIEKPVDMMVAREVEERLDRVNYAEKERHGGSKPQKISIEKQHRPAVSLPKIVHEPKPPNDTFPTKPSIAHPHKHTAADKYKRPERTRESNNVRTVRKSLVNDQRFASQENTMVQTKRYIVTREQQEFDMHARDGRKPTKDVMYMYTEDARTKDLDRKSRELEKRKRIEQWVDGTVEEKQKEEEIAAVAKQLVVDALSNAARTVRTDKKKQGYLHSSGENNASNFCDKTNTNGVKYHRVFGQ